MKIEPVALPPLPDEFEGLPTFVVGGWVRDFLRENVSPSDVDLMVAEVTPQEMRERGFRPIANDTETFNVFQDSLGREVAIARKESPEEIPDDNPHKAFEVEAVPPDVPAEEALERDLIRRDLTVNAMAVDVRTGELFDPHDGREDLENGVIRMVDEDHFADDPLRALRAARFAARLDAVPTLHLLHTMASLTDEVAALPPERHRLELEKALMEGDPPSKFFRLCYETGLLRVILPEVEALSEVPAGPQEFHQEGSAFEHTMMVVDEMADINQDDLNAMLMALSHDLGKSQTPTGLLPSHHGHGKKGVPVIENMVERLKFSNSQAKAMIKASRLHMKVGNWRELRDATFFDLQGEIGDDLWRMLALAEADAKGRRPRGESDHGDALREFVLAKAARMDVGGQDLIDEGLTPEDVGGEKFGKLLRDRRIERFKELKHELTGNGGT